jgi:hypothetical protein
MDNVVLVGKGPSTREVFKSDSYQIACLNNAIYLCEEVDYWFCHDQDNADLISDDQWLKVKNAIIPEYPQKAHPGGFSADYTFTVWSDVIKRVNPNVNIYIVRLGVHDINNLPITDNNILHMGETYSVLQTAATWLGIHGVQNIITCGLDPSGGYHPMFQTMKTNSHGIIPTTNGNSVWTPAAAANTTKRFHDIATQYKFHIHRLMDDGTTTQII